MSEVFPTAALQTLVREIERHNTSEALSEIAQTLENDVQITPAYAKAVATEIERIRRARATESELLIRIEHSIETALESE